MPGLSYSFSGIKTGILYFLRDELKKNDKFIDENLNDICASIQKTLVNMLLQKLKKAARKHRIAHIAVAGGVSANSGLRKSLEDLAAKEGWTTYVPDLQYCTDNAGMIGIAGHYKYLAGEFVDQKVSALPRMKF